jgi:hypothetical protein
MDNTWVKIKHPAEPALSGDGGGTVPSGTYSQARVAPHQEVVWARMGAQHDSPMYVVAFSGVEIHAEAVSDRQWEESFAASQDFLKELGDRALADFLAGNTEPLDPDRL